MIGQWNIYNILVKLCQAPSKRSGLDLSVLLQANAIVFVWEKYLSCLRCWAKCRLRMLAPDSPKNTKGKKDQKGENSKNHWTYGLRNRCKQKHRDELRMRHTLSCLQGTKLPNRSVTQNGTGINWSVLRGRSMSHLCQANEESSVAAPDFGWIVPKKLIKNGSSDHKQRLRKVLSHMSAATSQKGTVL